MAVLTRYRPNFCSSCGVKIIRLRWYPWTSRRFCQKCIPSFRKEHWLQPILLTVGLFALGLMIGRAMRPTPPPLVIERSAETMPSVNTGNESATSAIIEDDTYQCGARTKKGTPCSRRVHGPVRCWQHKGMPAMLPIEKLRIKD